MRLAISKRAAGREPCRDIDPLGAGPEMPAGLAGPLFVEQPVTSIFFSLPRKVTDIGSDAGRDTSADDLTKRRDGGGLYVGTVRLTMTAAQYAALEAEVMAQPSVSNNAVVEP